MLEKSIKGLAELREAQGDIEVRRWKKQTRASLSHKRKEKQAASQWRHNGEM